MDNYTPDTFDAYLAELLNEAADGMTDERDLEIDGEWFMEDYADVLLTEDEYVTFTAFAKRTSYELDGEMFIGS